MLVTEIKKFYTPATDESLMLELCNPENNYFVKLVSQEEKLLQSILTDVVKPWDDCLLQILRIPSNLRTLGSDLNLDTAVNAIVQYINDHTGQGSDYDPG